MTELAPTAVAAFAAVMADVSAVGKDGRNQSQGYSFRGIDGVMNAVGPALRKHGVIIMPTTEDATYRDVLVGKNQTPQRECTVKVRYTVYGPAGDSFSGAVYGEALDSGDKATAKAHSVAYRTFLLQALTIPTHDTDPDESSTERAKPWTKAQAKALLVELVGKDNAPKVWAWASMDDASDFLAERVEQAAEAWLHQPAEEKP